MASLATYDVKNYIISVDGAPLENFAEDDAFTVEWDDDWWTDKAGADGFVTRSHKNDRRAKVTIKLMQTSSGNQKLYALLAADEGASPHSNSTTFILAITSVVPGISFLSAEAYIMKPPQITGGREASTREWVVRCPDLNPLPFVGQM